MDKAKQSSSESSSKRSSKGVIYSLLLLIFVVVVVAVCNTLDTWHMILQVVPTTTTTTNAVTQSSTHSNDSNNNNSNNGDDAIETSLLKLTVQPKAFEKWDIITNNAPLPCLNGTLNQNNKDGFVFVKVGKSASTTGTSITLRIARNVAKLYKKDQNLCKVRAFHDPAKQIGWNKSDISKTFVWSFFRHPTRRHVSAFFYHNVKYMHNKNTTTYSDKKFQKWLDPTNIAKKHVGRHNYQTNYLYPIKNKKGKLGVTIENANEFISEILQSYNFIGIVERIEESVVALQMILGLQTSDVLHLDSKRSGTGNIVKTYVTPTMQNYFQSPTYQNNVQIELQMYKLLNASLDLTIDKLGREEFSIQLQKFRRAKQLISKTCSKEKWSFEHLGLKQKIKNQNWCVAHADWGCGFDCMDYVMSNINNNNTMTIVMSNTTTTTTNATG